MVKAQQIDIKFKKPSESILKFTSILFKNEESYRKWKSNNRHFHKLQKTLNNKVEVLVMNLSLYEEIKLALDENVTILFSLSGFEYFLRKTVNMLKECFQN